MLRLAGPHRTVIVVGTLLGVAGSLGTLAQPMAARLVLNTVAEGGSLVVPFIVLAALVVGGAFAAGLQVYILERAGERVVLSLRKRLIARLLRLRVAEYDRNTTGDLLSRAGSDTTLLRSVLTANVLEAAPSALTVAGAVALMIYLDWILFVTLVLVLAVAAVVVVPALTRINTATRATQDHVGAMTADLERALGAVRTVKAGLMEDAETRRISAHADSAFAEGVRVVKFNAIAGAGAGLGLQMSFLIILGVGGYRVATGALGVADLIAFVLYVMYLSSPIVQIIDAVAQLQKASAATDRILDVDALDTELPTVSVSDSRPDSASPSILEPTQPGTSGPASVEFDRVTFTYRTSEPVLDDVCFAVDPGTTTAIVGPSGAGKTTLLSLLERFYAPDAGRVLLDGEDVADLPLERLRSRIGYVEQSAPLLSGTLRENLLYGARSDVSDDALADAVTAARLEEMVSRLPDGLDTQVGERGSQLSGGERQRVACARLLLRRTGLVLLDEATSQLDAFNEDALRDALATLAGKSTTIVIAHRLATVVASDKIIVLDQGRVRGCGTHSELLEVDRVYSELARRQLIG